ncbi:hypothetical protein O3P69_008900 [Scylla paramamosain]|uniref:ZP domain-containing protein n=1 Tax=Scylla paramamosain TaxID=85552 RepID=A0AAW0TP67_SCYPA
MSVTVMAVRLTSVRVSGVWVAALHPSSSWCRYYITTRRQTDRGEGTKAGHCPATKRPKSRQEKLLPPRPTLVHRWREGHGASHARGRSPAAPPTEAPLMDRGKPEMPAGSDKYKSPLVAAKTEPKDRDVRAPERDASWLNDLRCVRTPGRASEPESGFGHSVHSTRRGGENRMEGVTAAPNLDLSPPHPPASSTQHTARGGADGRLSGLMMRPHDRLTSGGKAVRRSDKEVSIKNVRILCNSNDIVVSIETSTAFNGMIYPKGLSKNSSCMAEFKEQISPVLYKLPLKSCSTMSSEMDDGIEYFNTVVVQPHRKLVTNQGRGYHIRCKYQTQEKTVTNAFNVSFVGTTPLTATAPMPGCYMRIFAGTPDEKLVAENVRIGDPLTMSISLDEQEIYGMKVTDCLVRDGLGWGEQLLINSEGCPVDYEIFGALEYAPSKTSATVRFQAHKFPYISSVYYQCNVKLCIKNAGGCDDVPPLCVDGENVLRRRRRRDVEVDGNGDLREVEAEVDENLTIEVFTGLYVNEDEEQADSEGIVGNATFAIGIAIAGLILMIAVIASILILISRRRRRKEDSTTGSSIYSSPYTNTAYSHSS